MDGNELAKSSRILVLHLTNVLNTEMKFTSPAMTTLTSRGRLPYIVRTGAANIALKSSVKGLKLYVCGSTGKRVRSVPVSYKDGIYRFRVDINASNPHMVYELAQ